MSLQFVVCVLVGQAVSALPYNSVPDWVESTDSGITMDVCLFDVDNDGDLDAITAQYDYENGARLHLYLNQNGELSLIPTWVSSTVAGFECLTAADINNDGFMDVVAGTVNRFPGDGHNYIFYNNSGSLSQTPDWISEDAKDTFSIQAVDLDRDGRLELVTANQAFRLLFYENDANGLSITPIDLFQVCQNQSTVISKFNGILGADDGLQMLTAWAYNSERIPQKPWTLLYNIENITNQYPPRAIWSAADDPSYCDCRFYLASDLDTNGETDWLGNVGSTIWKGICEQGDFTIPATPIVLPCTEGQGFDPVYRISLAEIDNFPDMDGGAEIVVAAPGVVDPLSPETSRTMIHAANLIYSVDNWSAATPVLTQRWTSAIDSRSTTVIAVGDINGDGLTLVSDRFLQILPNQSYILNNGLPLEYVNAVYVDQNLCMYHCDRNKGLLSLVRDFHSETFPAEVVVEYYVSDMQDLFCGMVGQNVVYYHNTR